MRMVVEQWDAWIFLKRWGVFPELVGDRMEKHELDHLLTCHLPYAIASLSSGSGTLPQLDGFCCSRRQQER